MNAPASQIESGREIRASALKSNSSDPRITCARIAFFLTVIVGLLLSVNWFVCHTWNHFWGTPSMPLWQIIPSLLTISFVVTTLFGFNQTNALLRIVYRVSAIWVGVLSFTFFASVVCWFIYVPLMLFGLRADPRLIVVVVFGLAFCASVYGLVNAAWIRVTRITVNLPNLPEAWRGRSAALVTDLHLGNVRGRPFTRRVVAGLQRLQPDAVFISGDMFDGTKADLDWLVAPWSKLSVPRGTYFVTGNHEEFTSRNKFVDAIGRTGIRVLNNEKVDVDGLQIVGVHDGEAGEPQTLRAALQSAQLDDRRPSILLAHQPSNLAVAAEAGISLQLSGHTHGGQIWPWSWVAALVHGRFNYGLSRFGALQVFTSSGVGTWGMPMRVGTKSEIVLLRFEAAEEEER
jgi:predicted MPP superfamily phosphohydrolase